ncbi:unnamed protein product [Symbiodinium sp. CCMP2592]|nr:unnamed protein product [Symbiodinium sp. CCMP2592]
MNCTPEFVEGSMGHTYDASAKYPDSGEFAALLEAHGLILLNGWIRRRLQPTFVGAKHQSVIDFVITRRQHADALARRAKPCPEHNFSPWRMGGRHYAVVTSLPLHPGWTRQSPRAPPPQLKYNKQELDQEAREGGPRMLQLRQNLQKYLAQHASPTLEHVNDFLLQQVITAFPHKPSSPAPRAWQTQTVQGSVTAMWQARARLRQVKQRHCRALRACMEAFKRHREFMKAYKQLKLNGRQARKTLLNRELQNAAEAAHRRDVGQLHRIIRRLAPKVKRDTVRIHGPQGEMLRDADEHRTIVRHFEALFQSRTVTVNDVALALRSTPYGKAVPETSAPSSVVKFCADDLAQALAPSANACLSGACTPPSQLPGCFLIDMDAQSGAEALAQVQDMFPHLAPSTTTGDAPMESDKYRRPAGKGQNPPTGKSPPRESTQEPASASAGHTKQGRTRQWTDQADWQAQTTQAGWNKNKTTKELQKEMEALKEDVRLLSRIAMRHEDELSQCRTETDFILTLEVADPKATQEQEGLLLYNEIKVQEATASAESVENLAQQGLLIQVKGNPAWTYRQRQWDHQQEALIQSKQPPLLDTALRGHLQTLKTSMGSLSAASLQQFAEACGKASDGGDVLPEHRPRDPLALVCYRSLQALCYNSSNQLLKNAPQAHAHGTPLVRIIQETYPAPPTRSEEQRATYLAKQMQKGCKGKGKGREARPEQTAPEPAEDPSLTAAAGPQASRGA